MVSGAVSGSASNFIDTNNATYSGSLGITNGVIERNADPDVVFTYGADLNGALDGAGQQLDVAGNLTGDFFGDGWQMTGGGVAGTITSDFGTDSMFGIFVGE